MQQGQMIQTKKQLRLVSAGELIGASAWATVARAVMGGWWPPVAPMAMAGMLFYGQGMLASDLKESAVLKKCILL